jgi:hypothetical protein
MTAVSINISFTEEAFASRNEGHEDQHFSFDTLTYLPDVGDFIELPDEEIFEVVQRVFKLRENSMEIEVLLDLPGL